MKPLLVISVVVLAAIGGLWLWLTPGNQPSLNTGRTVAEAFLRQLQEGHPDVAWQSTTAEFKSARGKEAFIREVAPLSYLRQGLEFVSAQAIPVGTETRSEYTFRANTGETVRIVVGNEQGEWKVDRWLH